MSKLERPHLNIAAASHPGMARKQNEDRYQVTSFKAGRGARTSSVLAVLCDGIGGHRAGEVAAQMGVSLISEQIENNSTADPIQTMRAAITSASDAIYKASLSEQGSSGMGATCACAWVIGKRLYTANLGDSRIYLLREKHLVQVSTDHTWVQEAIDAGLITDRDSVEHPNAHVIRRYLGSKATPEPDFRLWFFADEQDEDALENQGLTLKPGDRILLCSDGLADLVSDDEIRDVILTEPADRVPQILIDLANQRGGHDNTTIVLLGVPSKGKASSGSRPKRHWKAGCLAAVVVISLLVAAVLIGNRWWRTPQREQEKATPTETLSASFEEPPEHFTLVPSLTPSLQEESFTPEATPAFSPSRTPWPTHTPGQ